MRNFFQPYQDDMLTCRKTYFDIPFAHRQHLHDGHCAYVHGHNWDISVTFACDQPDENVFVLDFGKLKFIKKWLDDNFDHACLFSKDDPLRDKLVNAAPEAWKIYIVEKCCCEGIARHLYGIFGKLVASETGGRVRVVSVEVSEDKKNTAKYSQ